jgi:hypothetical protein
LGKNDTESYLAENGRFSRHIRASYQGNPFCFTEASVIGDEGFPRHHPFDYGVAAFLEGQSKAIADLGPNVTVLHRSLGQACPHIQASENPRGTLYPFDSISHYYPQGSE